MGKWLQILAFILGTALLVYLGVSWATGSGPFNLRTQVWQVKFNNVAGLREADPVTVFGLEVGRVKTLQPVSDGVVVSFTLPDTLRLGTDAQVEILIKELLSGKQLAVYPGLATDTLPSGTLLRGAPPLDFALGLQKAAHLLQVLDSLDISPYLETARNLAKLADTLSLPEQRQQIAASLAGVQTSLASLQRLLAEAEQKQLIREAKGVLTGLDSVSQAAQGFLQQARNAVVLAESRLPALDTTVAQLQQALLKANGLLQEMQLIAAPLADPKGWPQQALQSQTVPQRLDSLANVLQNTLKILESGALEVYVRAGKTPLEKTRKK